MNFSYRGKNLTINRYPKSSNKSLRPWSAADELILSHLTENKLPVENIALYNDRFGFLQCTLRKLEPTNIIDYKSQEKAIRANLLFNKMEYPETIFSSTMDSVEKIETALVKVPKSLDHFQWYLQNISKTITEDGTVLCGFMTRNFSKQMIEIAELYFNEIEQSKAHKKARLLILKSPKKDVNLELINEVEFDTKNKLKQYYGVFSAKHIDYASQLLIENLEINPEHKIGVDLASGNGVLSYAIRKKNKDIELHLVDDMELAIESSKLNLTDKNTYFHYNNTMEEFLPGTLDFVISNPPFHFEFETNIEVSLDLFKQVKKTLRKGGEFTLVANQHLNYRTHLIKLFTTVDIVSENEKFIVYKCQKH